MEHGTKQEAQPEENPQTQTPPSRLAGWNQPEGRHSGDRPIPADGRSSPPGPLSFLDSLRSEIDRLFNEFGFGRGLTFPSVGSFSGWMDWSPETEVLHRDNELVIRADLPGLSKDDIQVDIEDEHLTIRGERRSEHESEAKGFYQSDRKYGSFYRSIPLPRGVRDEEATARFENGVLEILMPMVEAKSQARRIEIGNL